MWPHAVTATTVLLIASVASRLLSDSSHHGNGAQELLRSCLEWRNHSIQDTDTAMRLQHASMAFAYLGAARASCTDVDIERTTGVDVRQLSREIEASVAEAREMLRRR